MAVMYCDTAGIVFSVYMWIQLQLHTTVPLGTL